jgi:acyl-CoA thioester hydrolase
VFRWTAPVWQADVDAFGELRTSTLLKLLQETATRASSDAGFDAGYYRHAGTMWLVRRTTLVLDAPARYGDDLEVTTWIDDFRRVRSQRKYEVRAGARMVATAVTDWVYVDAQSRPRTIPDDMQRIFAPEGARSVPRSAMAADPPPPGAIVVSHRVAPHELDALAHVNNANYVHYVEHAAHEALATAGWPPERQLAAGGRLRPARHDLEYLDGALLDDVLDVTTWVATLGEDRFERSTLVTRTATGAKLLRAASTCAWIEGRRGAAPLPSALRNALAVDADAAAAVR